MIKCIIFDMYGTLVSTGNGSIKAAAEILHLNNQTDISPEKFYSEWKERHRANINTLKNFVNEEEIFKKDLIGLYKKYHFKRNPLEDIKIMLKTLGCRQAFPETKNVIDSLSKKYILAIGSTSDTEPLMTDLIRNRIDIQKIFTSENMCVYKPNPAFYLKILSSLELTPSDVLFVGDSLVDDVLGPKSVGIKTCWVNRKNLNSDKICPDFEIHNLCELFEILEANSSDINL